MLFVLFISGWAKVIQGRLYEILDELEAFKPSQFFITLLIIYLFFKAYFAIILFPILFLHLQTLFIQVFSYGSNSMIVCYFLFW
jgi:hypothetical protein